MQECNGFACRWIQNRNDPDHWVCLKCGKERHIQTNNPILTIIVFSAIALIFVSIFNSQSSPSPDQTLPESYMIETYDINP